jgi:two-component system chemotaxis response regulator CheB
MARIRILVVDDSVVIRKLVSDTLAGDVDLEVVGSAGNGRIALARIEQLHPDLITLDIEMPVMNGLETLAAVRKTYPKLPVIMFSTLTERGASSTLEALSLGASDYVTKPSKTENLSEATEAVRSQLIPKIKALCALRSPKLTTPLLPRTATTVRRRSTRRIEIVAIGSSTGGPNALGEVLPRIARNFPVPIMIVQHMPPLFTRLLAERLASRSQISIMEGVAGTILVAGNSWIAPGNFHMTVKKAGVEVRVDLNQEAPENSCRPAVDVLFRSVANLYGASALGVVMTGMGADGVRGSQCIREAGGEVIIQDEASAVVWGMPGLVYAAGQADGVYPLHQLAHEINRRVLESRAPGPEVSRNNPAVAESRSK